MASWVPCGSERTPIGVACVLTQVRSPPWGFGKQFADDTESPPSPSTFATQSKELPNRPPECLFTQSLPKTGGGFLASCPALRYGLSYVGGNPEMQCLKSEKAVIQAIGHNVCVCRITLYTLNTLQFCQLRLIKAGGVRRLAGHRGGV